MAKKFTTKKRRLRSRADKRRRSLKVHPKTFGLKETIEQKNYPVIKALEEKLAQQAEQ